MRQIYRRASGEFYEFYNLGAGRPDPGIVSPLAHGTGDLLDAVFEHLPEEAEEEEGLENIWGAVMGKPNAENLLINRIAGEDRCIVSDIVELPETLIDTRLRMITAGSLDRYRGHPEKKQGWMMRLRNIAYPRRWPSTVPTYA